MSINAHSYGDPHSAAGAATGDEAAQATAARSGPNDARDGSAAVASLLEKTAREIEQWRSEAKSEAAAIVAGGREEAAKLVREAREEADRLVAVAQDEAAQATNDARVEAYRVREETTAVRKRHDEEVAQLQQVATEHRERLRHHLTDMLDRVNATADGDKQ